MCQYGGNYLVLAPSFHCYRRPPPPKTAMADSTHVSASGGFPVYDDPNTFYAALSEFTQDGDNSRFESDIIYEEDGTIAVSTGYGTRYTKRQAAS